MKRAASHQQPEIATLFIAASEHDSNLYYATKFIAPDPFIYMEIKGERLLVMSDLKWIAPGRRRASIASCRIPRWNSGRKAGRQGAEHRRYCQRGPERGENQTVVGAGQFSVHPCDAAAGIGLQPEAQARSVYERRVVKTAEEVRLIEASQRATEEAVAAAHDALRRAEIRDHALWLDGDVLTSERIKS